MAFDTLASDYEQEREEGGGDDAIWIRRFSNPTTTIRFVPLTRRDARGRKKEGAAAWYTAREHFDPTLKLTFPCDADEGRECGGCNSANERIRKRSRRYYFPALDDQGVMRVFKMGRKLYQRFEGREQRLASSERPTTLSDRDYVIVKTGSGLDTDYEIEPGEAYAMEWPDILREQPIPDIAGILEQSAQQARRFYKLDGPDDADPEDEAEEEGAFEDEPPARPAAKKAAAGRIAPAKKAAAARPAPEDEEDEEEVPAPRKAAAKKTTARRPDPEPVEEDVEEDEEEIEEETPAPRKTAAKRAAAKRPAVDDIVFEDYDQVSDADADDLRAYLTQNDVEFPARAPRQRLVKMVAEHAGLPPY